jgi:hypothetical protein
MISLPHLNKLIYSTVLICLLVFKFTAGIAAVDIWEKKEEDGKQSSNKDEEIKIKNKIFSDDPNDTLIKIDEKKLSTSEESIVGIFDPEENNFNLYMWSKSDGADIKKIIKRIDKLKLSKPSEDLLFQVLFTNSYPPKTNLSAEEFLNIKINWLIKNKRIEDLNVLLKNNTEVGKNIKAIKFLVDEHLSSGDMKSACEKTNFIDKKIKNDYINKFIIYCLIHSDQATEAQLNLDLLKENGFKDNFFEDKISFLLRQKEETTQKILDDNLLNFYLSHITSNNFQYQPNENTAKHIWRYLSSVNLINTNDFENEDIILTYEQAAAENSFQNDEIFKIYLNMNFSFGQLINAEDIYKNLPNYKARALIYQSIMLSENIERKINLTFLLKDLFLKDKIFIVYADELSNILKSINPENVPEGYIDLVNQNLNLNSSNKIKFDNEIIHRSKILKHFLDNSEKLSRTEKDFKSVYKKIKKNKKYFISIKDIVVLESLVADGMSLPDDLDYSTLSSQLTVPQNLYDLANENQIGLVMLKIVEIIGEDKISDLDPETIYFLNKILNELNLKKIRNNFLIKALPAKASVI